MGTPAKTVKSWCKPMATHKRDFAKPVHDKDQPNAFHKSDGKGKGMTDERLRTLSYHQDVLRELLSSIELKLSRLDSSEITRSYSPSSNDADAGADEYENEDEDTVISGAAEDAIEDDDPVIPVIPYTISALDLATPNNPLQFLRTHGRGGAGKHIKKLNDRRMSTEHRKHGAPGFDKKIRLPRCRFGTRRMLDHPRDDPPREVCWFHKQNEDKWDKKCEKR